MSYIIAFVSFSEIEKEYPVQCFRTDLRAGDEVVVRRADGKLRLAFISKRQYLNWDCNGRIECRRKEAWATAYALSDSGQVLRKCEPLRCRLFGRGEYTETGCCVFRHCRQCGDIC